MTVGNLLAQIMIQITNVYKKHKFLLALRIPLALGEMPGPAVISNTDITPSLNMDNDRQTMVDTKNQNQFDLFYGKHISYQKSNHIDKPYVEYNP